MEIRINEEFLNQVVEKILKNKNVFGVALCVESGNHKFSWSGEGGNIKKDDKYFITSVSKLCVSAIVLHLRSRNFIRLTDPINHYLSDYVMDDLHVLNGVDYSTEITVGQLLSNTSGIPDYLSVKQASGKTADFELNQGIDQCWTLEKVLESVKKQKPRFKPGQRGKVHYSNTNYRLLGLIIEQITGKTINNVFKEYIFDELNLKKTYAYLDTNDKTPVTMYYKTNEIHIPSCIASVTAEGGIVSNAVETMIILKAFFNGHFFSIEDLEELKKWNFIFFPYQFYFGIGLEKLWVPWVTSPKKSIKEILGFWGSSGAFAFHNTDTDLYFTGTVNQSNGFGHKAAYKAMIEIIRAAS